ncbi:MAG: DUF72 domain-containing protein [Caulobacteraceae bacterium]|nr:DUF72 domain-containing protein [Caulobacteraceae bacterium]
MKGPRFITHIRRLKDVGEPLANFFASGLLRLGPKLGPILWQFPPRQTFDEAVFDDFLGQLPKTTDEALALARRRGSRLEGRDWLECDVRQAVRHAVEIRHESFRTPAFTALLRRHGAALVCADTVKWPLLFDLTADFAYVRLHGSQELYVSGYEAEALDVWALRARTWARGDEVTDGERIEAPGPSRQEGRDVFIYFDNDAKVRAPVDAAGLIGRLESLRSGQAA